MLGFTTASDKKEEGNGHEIYTSESDNGHLEIHHTILFLCMFESFYHKTFKEYISLKNLEKHFHSELEENNYI